jgi:glucose-6-phosphate isomerase
MTTTPFYEQFSQSQGDVAAAIKSLLKETIIPRIWSQDHTVWNPEPTEISNRLGWLSSATAMRDNVAQMNEFAHSLRNEGYKHVVLLGMGGSSLAPEVFSHIFSHDHDGLSLEIVDTTDADAIRILAERLNPTTTLFIVSTKSGGTVETLSAFKLFYNWVASSLNTTEAGSAFVAITDPGSSLEELAHLYNFRAVFQNDPNIGGRYSVLSYFGLLPATLIGVDVPLLLKRAETTMGLNRLATAQNPGLRLGAALGVLAKAGRDKLTLLVSPGLANFGDWVEQLVAESTGKNGTGILPVVGEPVGPVTVYDNDRVFVYLQLAGDNSYSQLMSDLAQANHPTLTLHLNDRYDLGEQFFLWEMATVVAGNILGIHPFDQPNVESAKVQARKMVQAYRETGQLPEDVINEPDAAALQTFIAQARPGDYFSVQAYVPPNPEMDAALETLRLSLRARTQCATTVGYGPRFLHSTGQLHKGDRGNGLFIQFVNEAKQDVPIPDTAGQPGSSMTFGVLKLAQALGDAAALRAENRRLIRFHLTGDLAEQVRSLA